MPYSVHTVIKGSPEHNEALRMEMIEVLRHSYVNPEKVIDKRFFYLDKIFLLRNEATLHGFCTYFHCHLNVSEKIVPTVFLGIMAASPVIQNTGLVLKTMEVMVQELNTAFIHPESPGIIWATTASPSSLTIFRRYFNKVSPDENNKVRQQHIEYEKAMKKFLLMDKPDPGYPPLVVKEVTPLSAYSQSETARIEHLQKKSGNTIFQQLDIIEARGDRLIMIGELD